MRVDQLSNPHEENKEVQFILKSPSIGFRLGWLLTGLIIGYIGSALRLPAIAPVVFIAVLAGISSNWSSCGCSMVGTIAPVVYRDSPLGRRSWIVAALIYTLGSIAGGVVVGALLGLLGSLLSLDLYTEYFPLLISMTALGYSLHEFRILSLPYPQMRRQVPDPWRRRLHPYVVAALFGFLLGIGFTTFIPTATYYIVVLTATLYGSPLYGAVIFSIYGFARASLLWPFAQYAKGRSNFERMTYYMDLTKPIMSQINGFALAMLSAYQLGVYLA